MDLAANNDGTDDGGGKFAPIVLDNLLSTTEQHFVVMGRSMKTLFVLALGQKNEVGMNWWISIGHHGACKRKRKSSQA
jgi:hypothetical protein